MITHSNTDTIETRIDCSDQSVYGVQLKEVR